MRRLTKYYNDYCDQFEKEMLKIGEIGDKRVWPKTNNLSIRTDYALYLPKIDMIGYIDVSIKFCGFTQSISYSVQKEGVPFYMNDCESLTKAVSIFYGSPFSLSMERIKGIDFTRYCVSVHECHTTDILVLVCYIDLLNDCLTVIDKQTIYD